jgi:hypothetical protein
LGLSQLGGEGRKHPKGAMFSLFYVARREGGGEGAVSAMLPSGDRITYIGLTMKNMSPIFF